jgi:NADH-quinone oxidoreductase subunit H
LQAIADAIKALIKEDILPTKVDKIVFWLAPIVIFAPILMLFAVIPFGGGAFMSDLNIGVLYTVSVSSIVSVGIFMAGWSSNNKYALLGSMRDIAQLVSYEIPMGLAIVGVVLMAGTLSLKDIVNAQTIPFILVQPLGFLIFFAASLAEVNRAPFDLLEADSEIVAGYNIEYSGMKFAMLYLAEYCEALLMSAMVSVLYLGGWKGPFLPPILWLIIKIMVVFFVIIWIRATIPRLRIDQVLGFAWKFLLPLALINLVATAVQVYFLGNISIWIYAGINIVLLAVFVALWTKLFRSGGEKVELV